MESTQLIPLEGDIPTITRRADEFKEHDDAIARNLQIFLPLTMEILRGLHEQAKTSPSFGDAGRLAVSVPTLLTEFIIKFSPKATGGYTQKGTSADGLCRYAQISHVTGCLFVSSEVGSGDLDIETTHMGFLWPIVLYFFLCRSVIGYYCHY